MARNQNDDDNRELRTTPLGLFNYARSYWQSAEYLFEAEIAVTHPHAPLSFLYYHAIELYLKAYLRQSGVSVNDLQNSFGHGVQKLSDASTERGLTLTDEDNEVLQLMSERGNVISSRYITTGFFQIAAPEALSATCSRLDDTVARFLREHGNPIRRLEDRPENKLAQIHDEPDLETEQRDAESYIEFMNEDERAIIAYLLAKKQKAFTVSEDGGNAVTLISRGIVRLTLRLGQRYSPEDVPVAIPDHIWEVLARNQKKFPYKPKTKGGVEPYPWRVHWMLR